MIAQGKRELPVRIRGKDGKARNDKQRQTRWYGNTVNSILQRRLLFKSKRVDKCSKTFSKFDFKLGSLFDVVTGLLEMTNSLR